MSTIEITIDFSMSGADPGNVPNPAGKDSEGNLSTIKPVLVTAKSIVGPDSLLKVRHPDTVLSFKFANAREGADPQFTGFRYYNTSHKHWDSGWFVPGGEGAHEFMGLEISLPPGPSGMTVIDRTDNNTLYVYVVEWSESSADGGRKYYCCDPKIKNEDSGGSGPMPKSAQ